MKLFARIALMSLLAIFFLSACQQNKLRECKGVVTALSDSTITAVIDGDSVCFEARDLKFPNGVVMVEDSVKISYIGRLNGDSKALLAVLIPKTTITDAVYDPNKELETEQMTEEKQKRLDKFVETSKQYNH